MAAIDILEARWREESHLRCFHPYLHIDENGLSLGAGTLLTPMGTDASGAPVLLLDGQEQRILAILSIGYRKPVSIAALKFIKRASMQWSKGEKAIAHFELAYARLPRFETRSEARWLFYADGLVKFGVSPQALMRARGLDTREVDLLKYNADQPRVPAGHGRQSGQWTSGDDGSAQDSSIAISGSPDEANQQDTLSSNETSSNAVVSDVSPEPVRPGQQYAQDWRRWYLPFRLPPAESGGGSSGGNIFGGSGEASDATSVSEAIEISSDRFGQAAEHVRDAISAGQPDTLTVDRGRIKANRAAALKDFEKVPGMHLDEYPPAMFAEGGAGARVRAISPHDNMSLGAYIGFCCRKLSNGSRIKIRVGE